MSTVVMVIVLQLETSGILQTPLTFIGANHWIPEAMVLFLVGRNLAKHFCKLIVLVIAGCCLFYPILVYGMAYNNLTGITFGLITGGFFSAVMLLGILSHKRWKRCK